MAIVTWPPAVPENESPELAALRVQYTRPTPEETLVALIQSDVALDQRQGFEGGRVGLVGDSFHAALFVQACEALRVRVTADKDIDDARAAVASAKKATDARDVLLEKLPPELRAKLADEAGAALADVKTAIKVG